MVSIKAPSLPKYKYMKTSVVNFFEIVIDSLLGLKSNRKFENNYDYKCSGNWFSFKTNHKFYCLKHTNNKKSYWKKQTTIIRLEVCNHDPFHLQDNPCSFMFWWPLFISFKNPLRYIAFRLLPYAIFSFLYYWSD